MANASDSVVASALDMNACSQCGSEHPSTRGFCTNCGAPITAAPQASPSTEPSICMGCGIATDTSRSNCESCQTPYPSPPQLARPQPQSGYWVAIRAEFTCNSCGFDVPLNHFELGEGVVCTRCGIEQRYDEENWEELVDFAHAVGDFGAPGPQGRYPDQPVPKQKPFAHIGSRGSWARSGMFYASPGNPLCDSCKAPLVVTNRGEGHLEVSCSSCGERRGYEVPPSSRFSQLAGLRADEHEAGRRDARIVENAGGVVVLQCPNCSAPLTGIADSKGIVSCGFCQIPCRISTRTHARAGHRHVPLKTWWLYFDQPSQKRMRLREEAEEARRERQAKEARNREREANRAVQARRQAERARKQKAKEKRAELKLMLPIFGGIIAMVVLFGNFFVGEILEDRKKQKAAAAEEEDRPSEVVLAKYSFGMPSKESAELFGTELRIGTPVKFKPPAFFEEASFGPGPGSSSTYAISLKGGKNFNMDTLAAGLGKLTPHREIKRLGNGYAMDSDRGRLRIDSHYTGNVSISTSIQGEKGAEVADALFAAVRHVALGGPELTPAQLRIVRGPSLADAARLDISATTEKAKDAFMAALEFGNCRSITNLLNQQSELSCTVDVYDRFASKVIYAWTNAPKARLRTVTLYRYSPQGGSAADPTSCLNELLGKGTGEVVDFASGRKVLTWPFGKAGDRIVLDGAAITFQTGEKVAPTQPAGWLKEHAKVMGGLAGCGG